MGLYLINCAGCNYPFQWHSGDMSQLCSKCKLAKPEQEKKLIPTDKKLSEAMSVASIETMKKLIHQEQAKLNLPEQEKMYTREEVMKLCRSYNHDICVDDNFNHNKWFEENLT